MSDILPIGQLIEDEQHRDAIHIAVAPVICGAEELIPGQRIGFIEHGNTERVGSHAEHRIGIVDPFLTRNVFLGQRFWMFLLPNTITSLCHDWTHPAFEAAAPTTKRAAVHRSDSETWLRAAADAIDLTYNALMRDAKTWVECKEHTVQHGSESWRDSGIGSNPEFWHHYEIVTGTIVPEDRKRSFYCCSC